MLRRARAIVKNDADAEDVVQEALERAWRSRERFIAGSDLQPWLLKITTNAAIDHLERRKPASEIDESLPDPAAAPEHAALRSETARSIEAAMQQLSSMQRTAFVLHDIHGYSSREISSQQQVPYQTVRTHLFRARKNLRNALSLG